MLSETANGIKRFIIREQIPCLVDFYREVEARTEEEALALDNDGQNNYLGFRVGDGMRAPTIHGIVAQEPEGLVRA